jgi:hypothetical protein
MKKLSVVGIDIAQQVLHLVGMDAHGTMLGRKRRYRAPVMACIAQLPPTLMGMEACWGAHDWARRFREHGHEGKLMAPQYVQPYVKTHNNDRRDAEAVTRPTMRFVPTKTSTSKTFKPSTVDANGSWGAYGPRQCSPRADARVWPCDAHRGSAVPASGGQEARVRAGHAHPPEPGDVVEVGGGVWGPGKAARL